MPCELTTSVDSVRPHNVEPPFSGTCSVLSMEASFAAEIFKTLRSKIENDSILDFFLIKLKLTQTVELL